MLLSAIRNKSSIFYLWILILFTLNASVQLQKANSGENPTFFNIGGVLSNNESEKNFSETIAVSLYDDDDACFGVGKLIFVCGIINANSSHSFLSISPPEYELCTPVCAKRNNLFW